MFSSGLIGSTEWVEEMLKPLSARAVAYINVDNINGNNSLSVRAVPLLYRAIVDAAAKYAVNCRMPILLHCLQNSASKSHGAAKWTHVVVGLVALLLAERTSSWRQSGAYDRPTWFRVGLPTLHILRRRTCGGLEDGRRAALHVYALPHNV